MPFPAHGESKLCRDGQIILADITGPWNLELIELYRQQIAALIPEVSRQGPWALIITLHRTAICPQDAIDLIRKGIRSDSMARRVCTCYVMAKEIEGYLIMGPVWRSLYTGVIPFEIFNSEAEARAWSEQQLALADSGYAP